MVVVVVGGAVVVAAAAVAGGAVVVASFELSCERPPSEQAASTAIPSARASRDRVRIRRR